MARRRDDYQVVVRPGVRSKDGLTLRSERHANFYTKATFSPFSLLRPDQFETLSSTMVEGRAATRPSPVDGRVLLAGGSGLFDYAASGDLFNPVTKELRPSGGLRTCSARGAGVPLESGAILIGGSNSGGALRSTEVYSPAVFAFQVGPAMHEERDFVAAWR